MTWIALAGAANARDTGGLQKVDDHVTRPATAWGRNDAYRVEHVGGLTCRDGHGPEILTEAGIKPGVRRSRISSGLYLRSASQMIG